MKLFDAIEQHESLKLEFDKTTTSVTFPTSEIADQLKTVTRLMQTAPVRDVARDIFYVQDGGYDTHKNSKYMLLLPFESVSSSYLFLCYSVDERLSKNFSTINAALEAFVAELKALNLWESTVLVQFSEFGRTLIPNTGDGTDHGWAGNHFMLGGSVKGGTVLGQYPDDFEQSNSNTIALSRGRMIPTHPWDAMCKFRTEFC